MAFSLHGVMRAVRAVFPAGSREETINFVRFRDCPDDEPARPARPPPPAALPTELTSFPNGNVTSEPAGGAAAWPGGGPGGGQGGVCSPGRPPPRPPPWQTRTESQDSGKGSRHQITEWQAGWNVTNAIQGMFIVTFPYTVSEGGYWALFAMVVVAYVCCYTGKILVECLYEVDEDGNIRRVRDSYVAIAEEVWGPTLGGRLVNLAQLVELLMTCILYVLLCGDLMMGSFPESPLSLSSWIVISSVMLLPCAFLKSLRHVSYLSLWCTVVHMFINAIIIFYCLTRLHEWQWSAVQLKIDIWTFPISLGVVIFSYTSQIFLPSLEANLVDRSKFHCMMHWTHVAAAIFKAAFSYIGFVTFGYQTKEVITNNLPNHALRVIVNLFLVAKALLSYPLPYFAAAELLEDTFFRGRPKTLFPSCFDEVGSLKVWGLLLRVLLVVVTLLMAIFIPHFSILMGLIGSFTGNMLSLVWPCYFHLKIKGRYMNFAQKAQDSFIIFVGLICACLGIYYSSHALIKAFQGYETRPFQGRFLHAPLLNQTVAD